MKKVGFPIWNKFMFHHLLPIFSEFEGAEFIILSRGHDRVDISNLTNFFEANGIKFCFSEEKKFSILSKNYDLMVSTFFPLSLKKIDVPYAIVQYGLAKDKSQFDFRWAMADFRLVYGDHSLETLDVKQRATKVGNPRFENYFDAKLDHLALAKIDLLSKRNKKSILYAPTWGNLSSVPQFVKICEQLSREFNLFFAPHHLLDYNSSDFKEIYKHSLLTNNGFDDHIDSLPLLFKSVDCVISDNSGVMYDALYCEKPVVKFDIEIDLTRDKKTRAESSENAKNFPRITQNQSLDQIVQIIRSEITEKASLNGFDCNYFFSHKTGSSAAARTALEEGLNELERHGRCSQADSVRTLHAFRARSLGLGVAKNSKTTTDARTSIFTKVKTSIFKGTLWAARVLLKRHRPKLALKFIWWIPKTGPFIHSERFIRLFCNIALRARGTAKLERLITKLDRKRLSSKSKLFLIDAGSNLGLDPLFMQQQLFLENKKDIQLKRLLGYNVKVDSLPSVASFFKSGDISKWELWFNVAYLNTFENENNILGQASAEKKLIDFYLPRNLLSRSSSDAVESNKEMQIIFIFNLLTILLEKYRVRLFVQGKWNLNSSYRIFGDQKADVIFSWHTLAENAFKFRREKQVCLKYGSIPGFFTIDQVGYAGFSTYSDKGIEEIKKDASRLDMASILKEIKTQRAVIEAKGLTKYASANLELKNNNFGDYILFTLQVPDDTVSSLSYLDTYSAFLACVEFCEKNGVLLIVRSHPKAHPITVERCKRHNSASVVCDPPISLHSAIKNARCVVTCNSGTGMEAIFLKKEVITFGKSDYGNLSHICRSKDDVVAALTSVVNKGATALPEEERNEALASYLFSYHVPHWDPNFISSHVENILEGL